MSRWLRRVFESFRKPDLRMALARREHLRVIEKASRNLPGDEAIREEVRRAERAMRGEAR